MQKTVVQQVTALHEQWLKEGPPPLGTILARWYDRRLIELQNAIQGPAVTSIQGRCPSCTQRTLFADTEQRLSCCNTDCPRPDLVNEIIGEITDARLHGGFGLCDRGIGHATMREFATKITEKVTAVAQRAEAVAYANEQLERANQAEAAIIRPDGATIMAARHLDASEGPVRVGSTVDTTTRSAINRVLAYIAKAHNQPDPAKSTED
jgi:ribosomal protein S27AE